MESKLVVARTREEEGQGLIINGSKVSFGPDENVLKVDSDNGCTILNTRKITKLHTFKGYILRHANYLNKSVIKTSMYCILPFIYKLLHLLSHTYLLICAQKYSQKINQKLTRSITSINVWGSGRKKENENRVKERWEEY